MFGPATAAASTLVASEVAKRLGADVYEGIKSSLKDAFQSARADLQMGFEGYLRVNIDRCDNVKTIVNRYQPVPLREIYEDSQFSAFSLGKNGENKIYTESELIESDDNQRVILSGHAGCGKSFFMKRTFIRFCEDRYGYIPIFVELRHLNNQDNPNLMDYISEQFSAHVSLFTTSLLDKIFRQCRVCLILDGFDELFTNVRKKIVKQIEAVCYKYENSKIIISGRPDDRFSSWSQFTEYQFRPMGKDSCLSLIGKAKFPSEIKSRFLKNVKDVLFNTHREYLQNPLMTYVMMLTSDQFNEFPSDITSFYAKAFDTLYSGHDVMKSGEFQREVKCGMKLKDLETFLTYFCATSFSDEKYEYTKNEAYSYFVKAGKLSGVTHHADDILEDLTRNYCLLVQDGTNYSYIHRTFQEYFSALCLSSTEYFDYHDYNHRVVSKLNDNQRYFRLLREVGRERFDNRYLIPTLEKFVSEMFPIRNRKPKEFINKIMNGVTVDGAGNVKTLHLSRMDNYGWYPFLNEILEVIMEENFKSFFILKENSSDMGERKLDFEVMTGKEIKETRCYGHAKAAVEKAKEELVRMKSNRKKLEKLV